MIDEILELINIRTKSNYSSFTDSDELGQTALYKYLKNTGRIFLSHDDFVYLLAESNINQKDVCGFIGIHYLFGIYNKPVVNDYIKHFFFENTDYTNIAGNEDNKMTVFMFYMYFKSINKIVVEDEFIERMILNTDFSYRDFNSNNALLFMILLDSETLYNLPHKYKKKIIESSDLEIVYKILSEGIYSKHYNNIKSLEEYYLLKGI